MRKSFPGVWFICVSLRLTPNLRIDIQDKGKPTEGVVLSFLNGSQIRLMHLSGPPTIDPLYCIGGKYGTQL